MFNSIVALLNNNEVKICMSKRAGKWWYMSADKDAESKCEPSEAQGACSPLPYSDTPDSECFVARTDNTMACSFIQVQSVKCVNRAVPAVTHDHAFENACVRSRYNVYLRECAMCAPCKSTRKRVLKAQRDATAHIDPWKYVMLIKSYTTDEAGNKIPNDNSWYLTPDAAKTLAERNITEEQCIAQYAQEHGGFTHADFIKSGLDFENNRVLSPSLYIVGNDMKFHETNIEHVFHKYVHDYDYLVLCNSFRNEKGRRRYREDLSELLCVPYTSYEYAFEQAAQLLREYKYHHLLLGEHMIGPFMFDNLISGIRNYFGHVVVYIIRLETEDGGIHVVDHSITPEVLQCICAEKRYNQVVCACHQSEQDLFGLMMGDIHLFELSCVYDYEIIGTTLLADLFAKYIWVADIADLWINAHEVFVVHNEQCKKYVKSARRIVSDAIDAWCAKLLDDEGVVIRPSETATIEGHICEKCIASKHDTHCYLGSTIVYFSERNIRSFRRYLDRLRDICAEIGMIGAHVRDTFCRKDTSYYDTKIEKALTPQRDLTLLQEEAQSIWTQIGGTHCVSAYGYKDTKAYMNMLDSVRDRQYSFLYTHSVAASVFYIMLATNKTLLSFDKTFKHGHIHRADRYLFSMGILIFNADDCDDECLYKLHSSNSIILCEGASSSHTMDSTYQIASQLGSKKAKRHKASPIYISELLRHTDTMKNAYYMFKSRTRYSQSGDANVKTLCTKFHCKYSPVYFEARFNDNDPIRLYDQRDDLNIWHVSPHSQHQYVYHKAHMFRVYIFGAFTNKLNEHILRYEQSEYARKHEDPTYIPIDGLRVEDNIGLNQCSNCTQNIIAVDHDSVMGDYINAHIAKVLPTIMSFYKFRSFSNTTPSKLDDLMHNNLFPVKACDSAVEFLYHEDPARIAEVTSQLCDSRVSKRVMDEILKDEKFYMIIMESDNTVYGTASTSVESMCEDIDTCYYDRPPVKHDGRNITISRMCHNKQDTKAFYVKYSFDFINCRDTAIFNTIEKRKLSIACAIQQSEQERSGSSEQNVSKSVYEHVLANIQDNEDSYNEKDSDTEDNMNTQTHTDTYATDRSTEDKQEDKENDTAQPKEHTDATHKLMEIQHKKLVKNTNTQYTCSVFDRSSGAKRFMKTHHSLISAGKLIGSRRKIDKPLRARRSLSRESRAAREGGYESDGYESCSEKSSVYRARSVSRNRRRVKEEQSINTSETSQSLTVDDMIQAELDRRALYEEQQKRKETEKENARLQKSDSKNLQKYKKEQKKRKQKNKRR